MEKRAAPPDVRCLTLVARPVLDYGVLLGAVIAPAEHMAFMNRMQGVDQHQRAIDRQPGRAAFLAEQPQQLGLAEPLKPAPDQPIGKTVDVGVVNACAPGLAGERRPPGGAALPLSGPRGWKWQRSTDDLPPLINPGGRHSIVPDACARGMPE